MTSLKQILKQKGFLPNGDYGSIMIRSNQGWSCKLCSIRLPESDTRSEDIKVSEHINGRKHRYNLNVSAVAGIDQQKVSSISQNTFIQTKLDSMKEGLIGLEYLLEIVDLNNATKQRNYYCVLCGFKGKDKTALSHMTLNSHRAEYLKKHFPTVYGVLKPFLIKENGISYEVENVLNEIANAIQKTFGRLKPSLVEAGEFYPDKIFFFTIIQKGKHINETSNKTFTDLVPKDLLAKIRRESLDMSTKNKRKRSISKSELSSETRVMKEKGKWPETVYSNEDGTSLLEQEWSKYSDTPEDHPYYKEEWKKFWKAKSAELKAEGKNPSKYDFKPEWEEYWEKRIFEIQGSRIRIDRARGRSRSPRSDTRRTSPQRKGSSTFRSRSPVPHRQSPRRRDSPSRRRGSPSDRRDIPTLRKDSPSCRRDSTSRRIDCLSDSRDIPSLRRDSPSRRRGSPSDRRDIPTLRKDSPSRRRGFPSDHRDIPSLRKDSSSRRGDSPSRRRISPSDHRDISCRRDQRDIPSDRRDSPSHNLPDRGASLGGSYPRSGSRDWPAHNRDSLQQTGDHSGNFENFSARKESLLRHIDKQQVYSKGVPHRNEVWSHRTLETNPFSNQRDRPFQEPPHRNESNREISPFRRPNFDTNHSALSCRNTSGSTCWGDVIEKPSEMRKPESHFGKSPFNQNEASLNVNAFDRNINNSSCNPRYPEIPPLMSVMTTNNFSAVKERPLSGEKELKRIKVSDDKFKPVPGVSGKTPRCRRKQRQIDRLQDSEVNLMPVLRLLTALEERLGSLGPQIVDLFSKVLDMENKNAGSSEKLLDDKNSLLLITAKEKLKGQIIARIVPPTEVNALNTVIANIEKLIDRFNRKNEEQEILPGVGVVDSEKLSQDIVNTLLSQGNNDFNRHEVTEFVKTLVSKEIPVTESNYTHRNQLSSVSGQQKNVSINQNNLETIARAISKKFFEKGASRGHIASLVTSVLSNVKKGIGSSRGQCDFSDNHTSNEYSLGNSSINMNPSGGNAWRHDTSSGSSTGQPLNTSFGAGGKLQFTFSNFGGGDVHQGIRRFTPSNQNPYN